MKPFDPQSVHAEFLAQQDEAMRAEIEPQVVQRREQTKLFDMGLDDSVFDWHAAEIRGDPPDEEGTYPLRDVKPGIVPLNGVDLSTGARLYEIGMRASEQWQETLFSSPTTRVFGGAMADVVRDVGGLARDLRSLREEDWQVYTPGALATRTVLDTLAKVDFEDPSYLEVPEDAIVEPLVRVALRWTPGFLGLRALGASRLVAAGGADAALDPEEGGLGTLAASLLPEVEWLDMFDSRKMYREGSPWQARAQQSLEGALVGKGIDLGVAGVRALGGLFGAASDVIARRRDQLANALTREAVEEIRAGRGMMSTEDIVTTLDEEGLTRQPETLIPTEAIEKLTAARFMKGEYDPDSFIEEIGVLGVPDEQVKEAWNRQALWSLAEKSLRQTMRELGRTEMPRQTRDAIDAQIAEMLEDAQVMDNPEFFMTELEGLYRAAKTERGAVETSPEAEAWAQQQRAAGRPQWYIDERLDQMGRASVDPPEVIDMPEDE